jgi:hypothetical protein
VDSWCYGSVSYERSCMRHACCYLACNLALWPLWLGWLRPEQMRCTEEYTVDAAAASARNASGGGAVVYQTTASLQAAAAADAEVCYGNWVGAGLC